MSDVFTSKWNLSTWIAEDEKGFTHRVIAESATEAAEIFAKVHDETLNVTLYQATAVNGQVALRFSAHRPDEGVVDDYLIFLAPSVESEEGARETKEAGE